MKELKKLENVHTNEKQPVRTFFDSIKNLFTKLFVILGVITLLWIAIPAFMDRNPLKELMPEKTTEKQVPTPFPKDKVNQEVYQSITTAYNKAESYASEQLDIWIDSVMEKADTDFLPWYFGFFNMKIRDIKGVGMAVLHTLHNGFSTPEEVLVKDLEEALHTRLFQPETTQLVFENILRDTVRVYNQSLSEDLAKVQIKYNIPTPEWNMYLTDLSHVVQNSGTSMQSISVKGGVALAGGVTLVIGNAGLQCTKAISSGITKLLSKTTTKTIAKSGVKASGATLGKLAGPLILVAVTVWDIADYNISKSKDLPVLRQNILEYMVNVKSVLLYDEDFGICTEINNVQNKIAKNIL